jgi:hypothetical protein
MPHVDHSEASVKRKKVLSRSWWMSFGGIFAAVTTVAASVVTVVVSLPVLVSLFHPQVQPPKPPVQTQLEHTPELGLEFWSVGSNPVLYPISTGNGPDDYQHAEIAAKSAPFEIHFPTLQSTNSYGGLQICAWTNDSIYNVQQGDDVSQDYESPFTPGKGLADTHAGSARLPVTNLYSSYWVDGRVDHFSSTKDKIYISTINDTPASQWHKTLYLTVWIDKNLDNHMDLGEYEYITVHFNA